MQLLAADIGGTHTRLQLGRWDRGTLQPGEFAVYSSEHYDGLAPIVDEFLHATSHDPIDAACFAVAGPVDHGEAKITNLPWHLRADRLGKALGVSRLQLVNDFEAAAWGLEALEIDDLVELQGGAPPAEGSHSQVLIGAGTGFGQAIILREPQGTRVLATEGGHVDFAPRDEEELALWQYLHNTMHRISYETLLSGRGLVRLFSFYCQYLDGEPNSGLLRAMAQRDPAKVISEYALANKDEMASRALDRFVRIYGAQAGNIALATKATGGVYVAGGIAPEIIKALQDGRFMEAFLAKEPMRELMQRIPVKVVTNGHLGLLGALVIAARTSNVI